MNVISVVCSIIEQDGKFLIARRPAGKNLELKWEFPGGKINAKESEKDALAREIKEELGIEIKIGDKLTPCLYHYQDFTVKLIPYICSITKGKLILYEHADFAWVDINSVWDYDIAAADVSILKEYRILSGR